MPPALRETEMPARQAVAASPTGTPRLPDPTPDDVILLDDHDPTPGPPPLLALPDPALRWRSPRNQAGRVEQVARWTYALAVARIITAEAERGEAS